MADEQDSMMCLDALQPRVAADETSDTQSARLDHPHHGDVVISRNEPRRGWYGLSSFPGRDQVTYRSLQRAFVLAQRFAHGHNVDIWITDGSGPLHLGGYRRGAASTFRISRMRSTIQTGSDLALAAVTTVTVLIVALDERRRHAIAREIHDKSRRCAGAWIPISGRRVTLTDLAIAFGQARDGTLFIDHLEELSEPRQNELADLLDARGTLRSGEGPSLPRVIAGAAPGIWDAVLDRRFSEPLFYRVNTIRLDVAALATGRIHDRREPFDGHVE
jgi:hypothetical protein